MIDSTIADLLEKAVYAWSLTQTPHISVAFTLPFTPVAGVPYVEVAVLPNRTQNLFIGNSSPSRHLGILQVAVEYPNDAGAAPARRLADSIVAYFGKGTKLSENGVTVEVYESPSVASPMMESDRIRVPVSVRYQSFA